MLELGSKLKLFLVDEDAKVGIGEISAEMPEEQIAEAQNLSRGWISIQKGTNKMNRIRSLLCTFGFLFAFPFSLLASPSELEN